MFAVFGESLVLGASLAGLMDLSGIVLLMLGMRT